MAYIFGDSFDLYAAVADAGAGYWDNAATQFSLITPGRFTGSQALAPANGFFWFKNSPANDAVHHIVCAIRQTSAITGSTAANNIQLSDGATAQCSIVFRSDGAILLQSGAPGGTTLATYTGAITLQNQWFAFEFEIVINNTTGSFTVRKNGNTSNDFTLGSLNTRGGTANNYANRLSLSTQNAATGQQFDDVLWRSDASSVAWVGDVRTYVRMPASDASVQFSRSGAGGNTQTNGGGGAASAINNTQARYVQFTPSFSGNLSVATCVCGTGNSGNAKCAIFDSNGGSGGPGAILGTATPVTPVVTGATTFTFSPPVAVTRGTPIWIGFMGDTSTGQWATRTGAGAFSASATVTYAAFPTANPTLASGPGSASNDAINSSITINANTNNSMVNDPQQDGATSYVYDSNVGDADFYGIGSIGVTPASIVAVTTRGFLQKSDAGSRSGAVQLRSGATGAFTPTTWNPADRAAITLSGSNLTATSTGNAGVRSVVSATSGKYYWETTANASTSVYAWTGIANATASLITSSTVSSALLVSPNGGIYNNGVGVGNVPSFSTGAVVCIAIDMGAQLFWVRSSPTGPWNATSGSANNPATGTGGLALSPLTGAMFAFVGFNNVGDGYTANFGQSAFSGAVPAGFTAGFGTINTGTTVQSTPGPLSTTWAWMWRTDTTDPATGAAWTATAVSNVTIGPTVTA